MLFGLAGERGARLAVLGRLAGVTTLVVVAVFPHRLEYVAHVLAGFGLAALGLAFAESGAPGWVGERVPRVGGRVPASLSPGGRAGVAMGLVVAGAWVWELTLGGPLDALDAANTTMGGLLAVAAIVGAELRQVDQPQRAPADPTRETAGPPGTAAGALGTAYSASATAAEASTNTEVAQAGTPGPQDSVGLVAAGAVLVLAGLLLRYPVQHELKTLWWFGPWG